MSEWTIRQGYKHVKRKCCQECGYTPPQVWKKGNLVVHHCDKDRTNNAESNLRVLCRKCHTTAHRGHAIWCVVCGKAANGATGLCQKHYHRWKRHGHPKAYYPGRSWSASLQPWIWWPPSPTCKEEVMPDT